MTLPALERRPTDWPWPANTPPAAIVAPMARELKPLVARMRIRRRLELGPCDVLCGELGDAPVVLAHTGDGCVRAAQGMEALLERFPVRLIVVVGIAGGLSPSLTPGSIVIAQRVLDSSGPAPSPAAEWIDRVLKKGGVTAATVVSTPHILCTPADKSRTRFRLQAQDPATVDLESATCARVASRRGIDYVVLRAVCDTSDETLPLDFNLCRDAEGSLQNSKVVWQALLRPTSLRDLWELRRRTAKGAERMAQLVDDLLNGGSS